MVSTDKRHRDSGLKPRIKICGLCHSAQALHAVHAGANAIGLILYADSARCLSLSQAAEIRASLPPFAIAVAVVVNPSYQQVSDIARQVRPHLIQFHGNEKEDFCRSFDIPYIKAIQAKSTYYIQEQADLYRSARAVLLDSYKTESHGGTGETFDYSIVPPNLPLPLIIAGGLTPDNVHSAIEQLHPYAVDVSSGVESEPRKKDPQKVSAFIRAVLE